MAKFHINPVTGEAGACKAMIACPFGGPDEHFDSIGEARANYEVIMAPHLIVAQGSSDMGAIKERMIRDAENEALKAQQSPKLAAAEAKRQELGEVAHFLDSLKGRSTRPDVQESYGQASEEISKITVNGDWSSAEGRTAVLRELQDKASDFGVRGAMLEAEQDPLMKENFLNPWFDAAGQLENALEGSYELLED